VVSAAPPVAAAERNAIRGLSGEPEEGGLYSCIENVKKKFVVVANGAQKA